LSSSYSVAAINLSRYDRLMSDVHNTSLGLFFSRPVLQASCQSPVVRVYPVSLWSVSRRCSHLHDHE